MGKDKEATASFWRELFQFGVYKRSQGRITRQVTFLALALLFAVIAWRMSVYMIQSDSAVRFGVPAVLLVVGLWLSFRLVNMPRFADFLIGVELEMSKVSWPSRGELFRSTVVVIVVIVFLSTILAVYDLLWRVLLRNLIG